MATQQTDTERAYELGYAHGKARASWLFDGNTTQETYRTFLRLYDDGDLPDDFMPPTPLSGEWAGESITELLGAEFPQLLNDDADVDDRHGDIPDAYEDGFHNGWWDSLVSTATSMIWTDEDY